MKSMNVLNGLGLLAAVVALSGANFNTVPQRVASVAQSAISFTNARTSALEAERQVDEMEAAEWQRTLVVR